MGAPRQNRFAISSVRRRVRGRDEVFSVPTGELVTGSGPAFRGSVVASRFGGYVLLLCLIR